ncbi:glycoside hydrolase family 3 protein [Kiloniella antarctica]|uniref:Glycoside hydrolase family 3 protein n=1 Tax=Kiloniella antarctica TaxID=1550907 RepID=A0ABW5BN28_9PROT
MADLNLLKGKGVHVRQIIERMTLEQKVGQLFMLAFAGKDLAYAKKLVEERYVSGFYITQDNAETMAEARHMTQTLQDAACKTGMNLPLIFSVDQEGAWGVLISETETGPGNLALGAADDTDLTAEIYGIYAKEIMASGYNVILSPCSDINSNPDNPIIGTRAFGESVEKVSRHVAAAVKGALENNIVCCGKHFPGHGDTGEDSHRLLPMVDRSLEDLLVQDLVPFQTGIEAGLPMIMTSHINFPQVDPENPATLSYTIMTKLLRERMGFEGVIVTDSMNMWGMRKYYDPAEAAIKALKAGCDIIMLSEEHYEHDQEDYASKQAATIDGVIQAVYDGELDLSVVEKSLERIYQLRTQIAENRSLVSVAEGNSDQKTHHKTAQEAAKKAITVIRDVQSLWPLKGKILLTGASDPVAHGMVVNTRGLGPNEPRAAYDVFCEKFCAKYPSVEILSFEDMNKLIREPEALFDDVTLVCVTEDYPLPGLDYDVEQQRKIVNDLVRLTKGRLVVLGLRSGYELRHFPDLSTYVCAYSSRACSAEALADVASCMEHPS